MRAVYRVDDDDLKDFLDDMPERPRARWVRPGGAPLEHFIVPLGQCFGLRTRPLIDNDDVDPI
jgi:hypothetical protein